MPSSASTHIYSEILYALSIASALSVAGSLIVIASFLRWRRLRRHPALLVVVRCVLDSLFCVVSFVSLRLDGDSIDDEGKGCAAFSALSQFLAIAAELTVVGQSLDLLVSITNPFTNWAKNTRNGFLLTFAVAAASAAVLVLVKDSSGRNIYGLDGALGFCWIRHLKAEDTVIGLSKYMWAFFIIPLGLIYLVSCLALCFARARLVQGLPETFEARVSSFRASWNFVFMYALYWSLAVIVYVAVSNFQADVPPEALALILAFSLGSRGVITCVVWLVTFGKDVQPLLCNRLARLAADEDENAVGDDDDADNVDLRPYLNIALRTEILYYLTQGVAQSVIRAERDSSIDGVWPLGSIRSPYNQIRLLRRNERTGLSRKRAKAGSINREQTSASFMPAPNNSELSQPLISLPPAPVQVFASDETDVEQQKSPMVKLSRLPSTANLFDSAPDFSALHEIVGVRPDADELAHDADFDDEIIFSALSSERPAAPITRSWLSYFRCESGRASQSGGGAVFSEPYLPSGGIFYSLWSSFSGSLQPFLFTDFEPRRFLMLRLRNGIKSSDYMRALSRTRREKFSEGASGAFLYFSSCERFIVKTMTREEAEALLLMVADYDRYLESHPNSLLARFYGCHGITMYGETIYVCVMHVRPLAAPLAPSHRWTLFSLCLTAVPPRRPPPRPRPHALPECARLLRHDRA